MTDEQLGYIAGFLDGDGSLRYWQVWQPKTRHYGTFGFELVFYNTNRAILERLKEWIGDGCLMEKRQPNKLVKSTKPCYMLQIRKRFTIYELLQEITHLLIEKRERAEQILAIIILCVAREHCQAATQG